MFYQWAVVNREVTTLLRNALHKGRAGLAIRGHASAASFHRRDVPFDPTRDREYLSSKRAAILARLDRDKFTDSGRRIHNFCSKFKVATVVRFAEC